jgi:hypothetical protein
MEKYFKEHNFQSYQNFVQEHVQEQFDGMVNAVLYQACVHVDMTGGGW